MMGGMARLALVLALSVLAPTVAACRAARAPSAPDASPATSPGMSAPRDRPYVLVLGTAQDGGLPQLGCDEPSCAAARADPARRRLVTSLLLCDPRDGRRWLFDCTPDLAEQLERARGHPSTRHVEGPRPALFD